MHLQVYPLGGNAEVSVSRSKPQNICLVLAYSKVVSEQNYVAGSCKTIVGRKNILGEKIVCKPPTRSKLRIIVCRTVSCEAIRSKGTVGSKQAFELIWIESQVRGKSLTHGQERATDEHAPPYVSLYSFMGGQERTAAVVAFQEVTGGVLRTHGRCVGKPSCQVQCENDPRANGIPKTRCEARPRRTVLRVSIQRVGDVAEIRGHDSIAIVDSKFSISGKIV